MPSYRPERGPRRGPAVARSRVLGDRDAELRRDEQDLRLGQEVIAIVARAPAPDLATVGLDAAGRVVEAFVQRRGLAVLDRERTGVAGSPGERLSEAHEVVERGGDEPAVQAARRALVRVGAHGGASHLI